MADFIEREAIIKRMEDAEFEIDCEETPDPVVWIETVIDTMLHCVRTEPAVDVVEVRHGRWVTMYECANDGVYCSVCHKAVYKIGYSHSMKIKSKYCPNCGADMRGADHEVD